MEKIDLRRGKVNYSDIAYEFILKGILSQTFRSGDALRPESIAETTSFSPTPIKLALARLAGEGLVELRAGQRPRVAAPSREEILEMFNIRSVLECHAVLQGTQEASDRFLAELDNLLDRLAAAVAARGSDYESRKGTVDIDMKFHQQIMTLWPNKRVQVWYRQLNVLLRPFSLAPIMDSHMSLSLRAHRAIANRIKARDAAGAADLLREHIAGASRTFLDAVEGEGQPVSAQARPFSSGAGAR